VAAVTVYSAPEDGRKGRPKHVEHTCSFNKHNTARVASCWFIIYYIVIRIVIVVTELFVVSAFVCFYSLHFVTAFKL